MFSIVYVEGVLDDLSELRAFDRKRILDQIDEHLTYQPDVENRTKKILVGLVPPWDHLDPVWRLRVGEYRVFYDVNPVESVVIVRAIRFKPPHRATEEIL